jgi:hypothetical protein
MTEHYSKWQWMYDILILHSFYPDTHVVTYFMFTKLSTITAEFSVQKIS